MATRKSSKKKDMEETVSVMAESSSKKAEHKLGYQTAIGDVLTWMLRYEWSSLAPRTIDLRAWLWSKLADLAPDAPETEAKSEPVPSGARDDNAKAEGASV